ncbi:MAG: carboxylating nicotinate-nucleotide diphosphorylase [Candidatus Melainabacteria bacterium]
MQDWLPVVHAALDEDLAQGDVTSDNIPSLQGLPLSADLVVRQDCVVSGCRVADAVLAAVDDSISADWRVTDGDVCPAGTVLATLQGSAVGLLKAERTMLNFMQHLSGVATVTRRFADTLSGTDTRITHTRKTTPGLRLLEQQAVTHGGGAPHRFNLGSAVMIKDNHWMGLAGKKADAIVATVAHMRTHIPHTMRIEVEIDRLDQLPAVLKAGADVVMLDNMTPSQVREALDRIQGQCLVEVSGNITLENIAGYALPGVTVISTSKLTLGAPAVDIGLDFR